MTIDASNPAIVVALDYADAAQALALADRLNPQACRLKVGKELFTAAGPRLVEDLIARGFDVFLDLKFHDIPNTVAKACEAAAKLGVWMLNVHASGGLAMMQAACEGVARSGADPLLIAVTVLTSMDPTALKQIGISTSVQGQVLHLAGLAKEAGLDGVVCSAQEATLLRSAFGPGFCLVTPGIRPVSASLDDQSRVVTPADAIRNGAHYLVIGRPITAAADPFAALEAIARDIPAR